MFPLIKQAFESNTLFSRPDSGLNTPLKATTKQSAAGESPVTLVVGSNASGKSFGVTLLSSWLNDETPACEPIQVSMKYRTREGMHRMFMFGPFGDAQDSTGAVSLRAITGALRTAKERASPCAVFLDEPDTGLSEDFTYALGQHLANQANQGLGENCRGLVIVTHSRALVEAMVEHLEIAPNFVHVGSEGLDLKGWLESRSRRSVDELLALSMQSTEVHRAVSRALTATPDAKARQPASA